MARTITTVALGFQRLGLSEEILHFLEHDPAFRVVGVVCDEMALSRLIREAHPAAVLGEPGLLGRADANGAVRLAVAEEESVESLREAIHAGAAGYYLWPSDRDRLAGDAARLGAGSEPPAGPPGRIVAVYGARGGVGATFLATNLAAAWARLGRSTCLVECDPFYSDLSAALGVPAGGDGVRTVEDLLPVLDELTPEHVEEVLHRHPAGFAALLGPHGADLAPSLAPGHLAAAIGVLAVRHEVVVLHLPRSVDELARTALGMADQIVLVVSLDVLALRDARRALSFLEGLGLGDRVRLVLNRVGRGDVVSEDAERVLGVPAAAIRADRSVATAQDRGALVLGKGGRTTRTLLRLARTLVPEPADAAEVAG